MNVNNNYHYSIEQMASQITKEPFVTVQDNKTSTFEDILNTKKSELTFSKHASERLASRNITLSDNQLERLHNGTKLAGEKGIKEPLVILDEYAFIVNTKNNMVITAMENDEQKVFTNIDGAVIM